MIASKYLIIDQNVI